jgi:hypothetical protein
LRQLVYRVASSYDKRSLQRERPLAVVRPAFPKPCRFQATHAIGLGSIVAIDALRASTWTALCCCSRVSSEGAELLVVVNQLVYLVWITGERFGDLLRFPAGKIA